MIVNRVWADLMGRGLVEPVDDLRATNPPSNGPLLDALADDFRQQRLRPEEAAADDHDVARLRPVVAARTSATSADTRNYSRHYRQRLRAEVLLDAVCDVTGVPETFAAMPPGTRAMELWTVRSQSLFLDSFGRPDPNQDPPCERTSDTTVVQALHLMNAPEPAPQGDERRRPGRAAGGERRRRRARSSKSCTCWCTAGCRRRGTADLREACSREGRNRRQATEDLLWALLNTPEFVFKD